MLSHKLTEHWRDLRKAVTSKNKKLAIKAYEDFITELNKEKANSKREANLYLAIERASELLIEQDEFFAQFRSLLKKN